MIETLALFGATVFILLFSVGSLMFVSWLQGREIAKKNAEFEKWMLSRTDWDEQ